MVHGAEFTNEGGDLASSADYRSLDPFFANQIAKTICRIPGSTIQKFCIEYHRTAVVIFAHVLRKALDFTEHVIYPVVSLRHQDRAIRFRLSIDGDTDEDEDEDPTYNEVCRFVYDSFGIGLRRQLSGASFHSAVSTFASALGVGSQSLVQQTSQ